MKIYFKKKKIEIPVKGVSIYSTGLILRTRNAPNLFFERVSKNPSLTAFFVFFPFLVLWLDDKKRVVDFRIAKPFQFKIDSKKPFSSIVEIPLNSKNIKFFNFFVGKKDVKSLLRR
jgi:uncharacterized membrane protein (UPF0127 family)